MVVLASSYPFTSFGVVCVDPSIWGQGWPSGAIMIGSWCYGRRWFCLIHWYIQLHNRSVFFLRRFQGIAMPWCFGVGDKFQRWRKIPSSAHTLYPWWSFSRWPPIFWRSILAVTPFSAHLRPPIRRPTRRHNFTLIFPKTLHHKEKRHIILHQKTSAKLLQFLLKVLEQSLCLIHILS